MDEKGFNDEELSDIMKEIEALEDDIDTDGKAALKSPVVGELAKMDSKEAIALKPSPKSPEKTGPSSANVMTPASMTFNVSGQMFVDLNFNVSGKTIRLELGEDGLNVSMDGGVTFFVPFEKHQKKSA